MPPNSPVNVGNYNSNAETIQISLVKKQYKWEIIWTNVILLFILYVATIYGFYLVFFNKVKLMTTIFSLIYGLYAATGVTAGTHRLWSHRSYQANLFVKIFFAIGHCAVFPDPIYRWVRDHRVHHKFTDTDADPHNSRRGLFYSHVGWLMLKKDELVKQKGKTINLDDILKDPVVMFQNLHKYEMFIFFSLLLPTFIPVYFWNEDPINAFWCQVSRFMLAANLIMSLNSFAHEFGNKPYDKSIKATDEQPFKVHLVGDVYHNYHHVFPWDYRSAEYPYTGIGTVLIYLWSKIGWTWDLRTASDELIRNRMLRTGDGTITPALINGNKGKNGFTKDSGNIEEVTEKHIWGWGDPDMEESEKEEVIRIGKLIT